MNGLVKPGFIAVLMTCGATVALALLFTRAPQREPAAPQPLPLARETPPARLPSAGRRESVAPGSTALPPASTAQHDADVVPAASDSIQRSQETTSTHGTATSKAAPLPAAPTSAAPDPTLQPLPARMTPAWVYAYTDVCDITPGRCGRYRALAMQIARQEIAEGDEWPLRLEREIDAYIRRVAAARKIASYDLVCATQGCLLFVGGDPNTLFGSGRVEMIGAGQFGLLVGMARFLREMGAEPWAREMTWVDERETGVARPEVGYWWESFPVTEDYGDLVVFERKRR